MTTRHAHRGEGEVKPASRESRLVMIQLEPRAGKKTQNARGRNNNKDKANAQ